MELKNEMKITIANVPLQWIPKIEVYYTDLPQFPIMYIHVVKNGMRIIGCPVSVSFDIKEDCCDAQFTVLTNVETGDEFACNILKSELSERIGYSHKISKEDILSYCKGNREYEAFFEDLWTYIKLSYGDYIPFGQFYEEVYSMIRFVSAWQPKTGRQSEMRMLYNFMSAFGERVEFNQKWEHLEYYLLPTYQDIATNTLDEFPIYKRLFNAMKKVFNLDFTKNVEISGHSFKSQISAWPQNKEDFMQGVTNKYLATNDIDAEDKRSLDTLVDAFNRHGWRAAFYTSAAINIITNDYKTWEKDFFKEVYSNGNKLKGYSEKVIACFLQQGFEKDEIIPIDTWIETFHQYALGIVDRNDFYNSFDKLGKIERVIWLASQANKTNMKAFFDVLWCQRYGTIGNSDLRGINPIACCECKLKGTCVGLSKCNTAKVVLHSGDVEASEISKVITEKGLRIKDILFFCTLENSIPKKVYRKYEHKGKIEWHLNDEFSGYILNDAVTEEMLSADSVSMSEFVNYR
ncbi:MAG TPA: hypothetical protein DCP90_01900 [Clostridiales bacterium]|nr:MAG: hypothetical protein A2Y22_08755 [Clostridiales bacterium GWD2_32_59]HAN09346.1 hypothetical protein [Clostridiales bacterium]